MDFNPTDEQKPIAETAREFAEREILPRVRESDRAERFDRDLARKLGEVGFLGPIPDERRGGRNLDYIGYGLIVEAIGRTDSSARTVHPGAAVTTFKNVVDHVVTEWGVAELRGSSIAERTRRLIDLAHPKFRDELHAAARDCGYLI